MKITKNNLFKNGKCRFCGVIENEKHFQCYHGIGDMLGIKDLELEYREGQS